MAECTKVSAFHVGDRCNLYSTSDRSLTGANRVDVGLAAAHVGRQTGRHAAALAAEEGQRYRKARQS